MLNIFHLFVLVSFLCCVKCDLEQLFQTCCALGKSKGTEALKCDKKIRTPIAGIPVEHQGVCLSTIDLCCVQFLREIACENGKQVAKQRKNCNIQPKSDDDINFKYCCEACKLGLITSSMSMDCKLKTFHFNNPWDNAYESCCLELFPPMNVTHVPDPINICDQYPGELCTQICIPEKGSFRCDCRPGSVLMADGKTCKQVQEDRCQKSNICDQNCFDNGESFECSCNRGYELLADGRTCVDVNECNLKKDKCDREGKICRNTIGGFECIDDPNGIRIPETKPASRLVENCLAGFKFDRNANKCVDIDECREAFPCKRSEICYNIQGSFQCILKTTPAPISNSSIPISCGSGFVYNAQINRCVDINECDSNRCAANEICENLHGSFQCKCKTGFQKNISTGACIDVNECQLNLHSCDTFQRCDNTVGSYQCVRASSCGTGYTLNLETNICEDDDECLLGTDNCKWLGTGWECRNIAGSFRCEKKRTCDYGSTNCTSKVTNLIPECPKGYEYEKGLCVDIDECQSRTICPSDQNCLNTPGSFRCVSEIICSPGLRLQNSQYCVDIDECAEQHGLCDHKCINIWGSFHCSCNTGYLLHSDNRSCIDINECELFKNRRLCLGICINTPGSYKCQCPEGYRLSSDGVTCNDINECNENKCTNPSDVCVNIGGSHRCNTLTCPINYVQDPTRKNRCMRVGNFCILNPRECLKLPLFYSFNYLAFPSNVVMPASGQQAFFYMKGISSQTMMADQTWELSNASAPNGIVKVTRDYFRMNHDSANEITLFLVKPIQGPQEIEILIRTSYSNNGVFSGFALTKLFIYVSQYDF